MAVTQAMYRQEFVSGFEQKQSALRDTVLTEVMVKGVSATFLVTGVSTGSGVGMINRGVDGRIPARTRTDAQVTTTLKEMHDLQQETSFNIFVGQSDRRRIMQESAIKIANQEIDKNILLALSAASNSYNSGSAVTPTKGKILDMISELWKNEIDETDQITFVWTPKSFARLQTILEITSKDYVTASPLAGNTMSSFMWGGAKHLMSNRLTGKGTSTAQNYVYAKNAVGHAIDTAGIQTAVGYNEEMDYSFARATMFHNSVILQQGGVLKVITDDTAVFS
jgi:hypothetical protein